MWVTVLAAGAAAGLASIPHCAAMCGPLAAFACARGADTRPSHLGPLAYQAGRTVSYAAAGVLAGSLGHAITGGLSQAAVGWVLSWAMAAALAVAAVRLWRAGGPAPAPRPVPLRPKPAPRTSVFERLTRLLPRSPLAIGTLTPLLPCGALAGALLMAAGTTSPTWGAVSMAAFATTSGIGLLGVGYLARHLRLSARPVLGRSLAVALGLGAVLLALRPLPLAEAHHGAGQESAEQVPVCH